MHPYIIYKFIYLSALGIVAEVGFPNFLQE